MNKLDEDEEMKEPGFSDFDVKVSINKFHPSIFHHHKLDSFILKSIQDPYNIIGGGITSTLE